MKFFTKSDKRTNLQKEIDSLAEMLNDIEPLSTNYILYLEILERLVKAQSLEKPRGISPDTKAIIVGNMLVTAAILYHEKAGVITSKAFSYIIKGRV